MALEFTPLEHQEMGIKHLLTHDQAALFAGMGLGKTGMVLAALSRLILDGACRGALIIAPLRVSLFTWPDEVAKWGEFKWMPVVSLRTPEGLAAWGRGDACIYTINYEALFIPRTCPDTGEKRDTGMLSRLIKGTRRTHLPVDTVIWDEMSNCKSPGSKRVREFRKYWPKFKRHWGLTGTPTPNSLLDLFAQIRLLDNGETFGTVMGNYKIQYFEPVDYAQRKWQVRAGCQGMIEEKISKIALTLRSEDWLDIPPVSVTDVEVKLPPKAWTRYKKLQKELILKLQTGVIRAASQGVLVGKLQQFVGGAVYADSLDSIFDEGETTVVTHIHDAKIKALRKLFDGEGKKPMLVIVRFKHEIARILEAFPEAVKFHSDKLDGWNAGKIKMLVSHPLSMSHGLNMQSGGSRICWFTVNYSREQYDQTNARLARTGQKHETRIFRLLVPLSIDDAVVSALESKGDTQSAFLQTLTNLRVVSNIK